MCGLEGEKRRAPESVTTATNMGTTSECPQQRKSKYSAHQPMRPSAIECLLCTENDYMRKSQQLETAKRLLSQ